MEKKIFFLILRFTVLAAFDSYKNPVIPKSNYLLTSGSEM